MKHLCLLLIMVVLTASAKDNTTYYVVSSQESSLCPDSFPCQSLQYYLNNSESLSQLKSISLIFLKGNHSADCAMNTVTLSSPNITMIGEHPQTLVRCLHVHFRNNNVVLYKLILLKGTIQFEGQSLTPTYNNAYLVSLPQLQLLSMNIKQLYIDIYGVAQVWINNTSMKHTYLNIEGPNVTSVAILGSMFHDGTVAFRSCRAADVKIETCELVNNQALLYDSSIAFLGHCIFSDSLKSSILSISSTISLSGNISFVNNTAYRGGAITLYSSDLEIMSGANVTFISNSAKGVGGAIYVDPDLSRNLILWDSSIDPPCFYRQQNCTDNATYSINFINNFATNGGDDVYGASLDSFCSYSGNLHCHLSMNAEPSVSSNPTRVCICDHSGHPQCNKIVNKDYHIYSGEELAVRVVVVGGDFGPTVGIVHAGFLSQSEQHIVPSLKPLQHSQLISSSKQCTSLVYNMYSEQTQISNIVMYLTVAFKEGKTAATLYDYSTRNDNCSPKDYCSRVIPVFINITLFPCPVGFTLLGDPPGCECYPELTNSGIECKIVRGRVLFSWKGNLWIDFDISRNRVVYSQQCPFNYCNEGKKEIDLATGMLDSQCSFNRAGRLCGGCKFENYSVAIGSSNCIHCPGNDNLALFVFFAAAGLLLVFFISALNLTVTQGTINGLIFYANIVWTYDHVFFPPKQSHHDHVLISFLRVFIAWINLDFGIETCFVSGLTAFWKTWLQFLFPFYIWTIGGLIIFGTKYSTKLTNILGSRAVPVLNTLFLLSYTKLLNAVVDALEFSILVHSDHHTRSTSVIWSVDGNLLYFGFPHILLFLTGLAILLFLWLPYTLLLLLMQWLRRLPQSRLRKWLMRYNPVFDAYFAPLKERHHYVFGVLLLVRGTLLVTFASTFDISQDTNLLLLLTLTTIQLLYLNLVQPYKGKAVLLFQSTSLINLNLLSGFFIFTYTQSNKSTLQIVATGLSTGTAFLQFCVTILHALISPRCSLTKKKLQDIEMIDHTESLRYHAASLIDAESDDANHNSRHKIPSDTGVKLQPLLMSAY